MIPSDPQNHEIIAHRRQHDGTIQSLQDHLLGTSQIASQFAEDIGLKECGELMGLLHDLGKASLEFQNYIRSGTGMIDEDADEYVDAKEKKGKINHSAAGGQFLESLFSDSRESNLDSLTGQLLALCVLSHHSGLIDCLDVEGVNVYRNRLQRGEETSHYKESLMKMDRFLSSQNLQFVKERISQKLEERIPHMIEPRDTESTVQFKFGLLVKFLFSCLVDADRIDTANFESPENESFRSAGPQSWGQLIGKFEQYIETRKTRNSIDQIRREVSLRCLDSSKNPKGLYQLTVPTGGGKTLSSLRFALHHAEKHKMNRIIYIIPYTSIIDQNAQVVRSILEDSEEPGTIVLEHHSNLTPEIENARQKIISENWDAPIVFTTMVQFLESLFGAGTRNIRRMHQMANAVLIFDEIQTLPIHCVHLFNLTIRFLCHACGSTAMLCTATQPLLDQVKPKECSLTIGDHQKIIPNPKELYQQLKRTNLIDHRKTPEGWDTEDIVQLTMEELQRTGSVLIITNTKKSAGNLFQSLKKKEIAPLFHLSTNMCPAHRKEHLLLIRKRLERSEKIVCVSTQLIEAGVDVDFGTVIRFMAGMDSIVQAAGRCNRNGKHQNPSNVYVINPKDETLGALIDITEGKKQAERVFGEFSRNPDLFENDLLSLSAMELYYRYYFHARSGEMSYPLKKGSFPREDTLVSLLSKNTLSIAAGQRADEPEKEKLCLNQSFKTASKAFQTIVSPTRGVVVPYSDRGKEIIANLCGATPIEYQRSTIKRAQQFSINVFSNKLQQMIGFNMVQEVQKHSGILYLDERYYSEEVGFQGESSAGMDVLIG